MTCGYATAPTIGPGIIVYLLDPCKKKKEKKKRKKKGSDTLYESRVKFQSFVDVKTLLFRSATRVFTAMAELEDDHFPNDFDGLDFDNIPGLQALPVGTPQVSLPPALLQNVTPSTAASPVPSNGSNSVEDMDSAFLAAVDALEAHALGKMARGKKPQAFGTLGKCCHANLGSESVSCAESGLSAARHIVFTQY